MVCEQRLRPRLRARGGDGASTRDGIGWIGFRRAGIAVSLDREGGAVACVRGRRAAPPLKATVRSAILSNVRSKKTARGEKPARLSQA